ncbi:MAG: cobalamin biosynthesis protein [Actinomycetota bacterium]|nr:cobalamin biosynthesis protein [Actinomycetota bacterium]
MPTALVADAFAGGTAFGGYPMTSFERAIGFAEEILWTDTFFGGLRFVLAGALPALLAGKLAGLALGGFGADAAAGSACVELRSLRESALTVVDRLGRGDLAAAAAWARGSDKTGDPQLSFDGVVEAAIETIATKLVEEVVGPLVFLNLAGASGALAYRAVGTMSGKAQRRQGAYARFGAVPMRLSEILGRFPGRLAALAICSSANGDTRTLYLRARQESLAHPSPGTGLVRAAMACALEVGPGAAGSTSAGLPGRQPFGPPRTVRPEDIEKAVVLAERASVLVALWLMATDLGLWVVSPRLLRRRRQKGDS